MASVGAAAMIIVMTWLVRHVLTRGRNAGHPFTALEIAYLNGGLGLACQLALAELHRLGAVRTASSARLVVRDRRTGRPLREASALLVAVYSYLREPRTWQMVLRSPKVLAAVGDLDQELVRRGWLISPSRHRWIRWLAVPGWAAAALSCAQIIIGAFHFSEPGAATMVLVQLGVLACLLVSNLYLIDVPAQTGAGRTAVKAATRALTDRADRDGDTLLRVAVQGAAAIRAAYPAFARYIGADDDTEAPFPQLIRRGIL